MHEGENRSAGCKNTINKKQTHKLPKATLLFLLITDNWLQLFARIYSRNISIIHSKSTDLVL